MSRSTASISALLRLLFPLGVLGVALASCSSESPETNDATALHAAMNDAESSVEGQSGSEVDPGSSGADTPACPCGLQNPLRATVLEVQVEADRIRLRVDELLAGTTGVEVGSEIEGQWFGQLPCFYGCADVAVGDQVLAFYVPESPCVNETGDDCPLGPTIAASIRVAPWSDPVVLARTTAALTIGIDELGLLQSLPFEQCLARWNASALPNLPSGEGGGACTDAP